MIVVTPTALDGVVVVEPKVFPDERGFFLESFNARHFAAAGLPARDVGGVAAKAELQPPSARVRQ